ncbi:hypothetical protein K523DRAFT_349383 [Schizophyllum commune Tattone D]|nr:hypothetical protein K523DRAFT_349383 [Schizophyllum commune Tattone D]
MDETEDDFQHNDVLRQGGTVSMPLSRPIDECMTATSDSGNSDTVATPSLSVSLSTMYGFRGLGHISRDSGPQARTGSLGRVLRDCAIDIFVAKHPHVEAAWYAYWDAICLDHFQAVDGVDEDQNRNIASFPLPQWPADAFLVDQTPAIVKNIELDEKERSRRIADFSQITVVCTSQHHLDQIIRACFSFDTIPDFRRSMELSEVSLRCTLLVEIKPPFTKNAADNLRRWREVFDQVQMQGYHALAGEPKAKIIGGIIAFGSSFSYLEIFRDARLMEKALLDKDRQAWELPEDIAKHEKVRGKRERHLILEGTRAGRLLYKTFDQGKEFLDANTVVGKQFLSLINHRAEELSMDLYE